jgi:hypothetical protein
MGNFIIFSLALHWIFGWQAFKSEQHAHNLPIIFPDYLIEMLRDNGKLAV